MLYGDYVLGVDVRKATSTVPSGGNPDAENGVAGSVIPWMVIGVPPPLENCTVPVITPPTGVPPKLSRTGVLCSTDSTPVPGLYAAGACTSHLPQDGDEYASGMSLAAGSIFGRRAGVHAAAS